MSDMKTLNITDHKETGLALVSIIEKEHASTQSFLIQPYPSEIEMKQAQFDDLMRLSGRIDEMYNTDLHMYRTESGYVMEVVVTDPKPEETT